MARWKLTLEYDGTGFAGWQRQPHASSVQQALEEAIAKFSGETVTAHAAGRTDAGVHARAQVAHIDLIKDASADTVRDAINFHLRPHLACITAIEQVGEDFHARFGAVQRSYRYHILNRVAPPVLAAHRVWHIIRPLDVGRMQTAADLLIGHHDFSTFRAYGCQAKSPLRTLDHLRVVRDEDRVVIETAARSFLYHQVRNMAGTLMMVGCGRWSLDQFHMAFRAMDRVQGGPTAPACGLIFWNVAYDDRDRLDADSGVDKGIQIA